MSDSRLEKFIYAICSMDVSDLPVPLSRIEKLWNCLITGETPDFEPLSRNEKYLMAMLDRYDISNLPAPMSRGEKLLYKIAVGETDLSDVPGYLSRYEELLKYLIENGGISGGDFEYVLHTINQSLYTLYTTAEKPVKRAILKGQTLVNIDSYYDGSDFYNYGADYIDEDGFIQLTAKGTWVNAHTRNNSLVKPNTKYAIIVDIKENTLDSSMSNALKICTNTDTLDSVWSDINGIEIAGGVTGRLFFTATTSNEVSSVKMLQRAYIGSALKTGHIKYRWMIIEYQKGMENWDIPYFRGMTSVKMPVLTTVGKNLIGLAKEWSNISIDSSTGKESASDMVTSDYIINPIKNRLWLRSNGAMWNYIYYYDINKTYLGFETNQGMGNEYQFDRYTITGNEYYVRVSFMSEGAKNKAELYTEKSGDYIAYKSNILTVNEDVELRGIGDVKDELNLLTGELTQRVSEIILDGSEDETYNIIQASFNGSGNTIIEFVPIESLVVGSNNDYTNMFLSNYNYKQVFDINWIANSSSLWATYLGITNLKTTIRIIVANGTTDAEIRQHLRENPLRVVCKSETTVKTVDLTVVDQDDQPTQLGTFENITHVSLEAENLIPEVEMEVATRISEELASASPLMDDISTEQQQLETTIDEQSNNVDATMIATTEIYEEIL